MLVQYLNIRGQWHSSTVVEARVPYHQSWYVTGTGTPGRYASNVCWCHAERFRDTCGFATIIVATVCAFDVPPGELEEPCPRFLWGVSPCRNRA